MKNVPEIRFKGFEEEWKTYILSSIGNFRSNGVDKKIYNDEQIVNLLNYMDVYNYRKITSKNCKDLMKVSATKKQIKDCNIIKGDIFFTPSSETPDEIGYVMSIEETLPNTCYSYHLMRFRPFDRILYLSFADYCFSSNYFRGQMKFKAKGVQRFILSKPDFESLEALLPSYEEQEIITCLFKAIDNVINDCKKKIASLKQLKSACLISMFPQQGETVPRVRFKGFDGEWKICELKQFAFKVTRKNCDKEFTKTFTNSAEFGVINQNEYFDRTISNSENIGGYYVVENSDYIYNPRVSTLAPVGPINRNKLGYTGVVSPLYLVFKTNNIDKDYLDVFFNTNLWHRYMKLEGNCGARFDRLSISDELFFEMPIILPSNEAEQHQIASYFHNLDIQISEQEKRLEKLKQIKAACLDKMFV